MKSRLKKAWPLEVVSVDRGEMSIGAALVLCSFIMPLFFTVQSFQVMDTLWLALSNWEKTELMESAMRLVTLNALRGVPHYIGSYFVGESIEFRWKGKNAWLVNALLIVMLLRLTYRGIGAIHGIHYDFSIPAVMVSACVVLFRRLDYQYISLGKKAILISLFLTAFQFLDVMPAMDGLPVGRGETSGDIKMAAALMESQPELNVMAMIGVLIFALFSVLIFFQLRDENNLRELNSLREQSEAMWVRTQLNEMKNRTFQEMQYLVHDLKSPLTAMQTLVGVLKMKGEMEGREDDVEYLSRIELAGEQMNRMISEILYQDQCSPITTQELLDITLAQSSVTEYASYIRVENNAPDACINANRMLFPRVLINLMQNSAQAIPEGRTPHIWLRVERDGKKKVVFSVLDNGWGIDQAQQDAIWDRGVSGRDSSGLGLAFAHNVVENMGGEIHVKSEIGKGTRISIVLRQEGE